MKSLLALIPLVIGSFVLFMLCDFDTSMMENALRYITPFDWHAIGAVLYCGAIIGWERMLKNKVLGMRTSIFITLGTYMFTAISMQVAGENGMADATRVIGQIVSGIGFLGAGVMFARDNKVTGLTSAATIWMLAAIGICIGTGYLATSVIISTLGVMLLIIINEVDDGIVSVTKSLASSYKTQWRVYEDYNPHAGSTYYVQFKDRRFGFWQRCSSDFYMTKNEAQIELMRLSDPEGYKKFCEIYE